MIIQLPGGDASSFWSDALIGIVGVSGVIAGAIATHVFESRRRRLDESERDRNRISDMRNNAFLLLSTFRSEMLISIARWRLIKDQTSIKKMDPEKSPFVSREYFQLSGFCGFWFPETAKRFSDFDAKINIIHQDLNSSEHDSIESFVGRLERNLDLAASAVDELSRNLQRDLVGASQLPATVVSRQDGDA